MLLDFLSIHNIKWIHVGWFILYMTSIGFLVLAKEGIPRKIKALGVSSIVVLLIAYNPIIMVVFGKFFDGNIEYTRITWGVLVIPIVASVMTLASERRRHCIIICLMSILLVSQRMNSFYSFPENIHKISSENIEIADFINVNTDKAYPTVAVMGQEFGLMEGDLNISERAAEELSSYSSKYQVIPMCSEDSLAYDYYLVPHEIDSEYYALLGGKKVLNTEHFILYLNTNNGR